VGEGEGRLNKIPAVLRTTEVAKAVDQNQIKSATQFFLIKASNENLFTSLGTTFFIHCHNNDKVVPMFN
jgi:hypothetical protein